MAEVQWRPFLPASGLTDKGRRRGGVGRRHWDDQEGTCPRTGAVARQSTDFTAQQHLFNTDGTGQRGHRALGPMTMCSNSGPREVPVGWHAPATKHPSLHRTATRALKMGGKGRERTAHQEGVSTKMGRVRGWPAVPTGLRKLKQVSMSEAQIETITEPCFSQVKTKPETVAKWVEHSPSVHSAPAPSPSLKKKAGGQSSRSSRATYQV